MVAWLYFLSDILTHLFTKSCRPEQSGVKPQGPSYYRAPYLSMKSNSYNFVSNKRENNKVTSEGGGLNNWPKGVSVLQGIKGCFYLAMMY